MTPVIDAFGASLPCGARAVRTRRSGPRFDVMERCNGLSHWLRASRSSGSRGPWSCSPSCSPAAQQGPGKVSTVVTRTVRLFFGSIARLTGNYERKDAILAPIGPIAVLAQLLVWLALFAAGFVLMLVTYTHHLDHAISQIAAAMFTLGLARTVSASRTTRSPQSPAQPGSS